MGLGRDGQMDGMQASPLSVPPGLRFVAVVPYPVTFRQRLPPFPTLPSSVRLFPLPFALYVVKADHCREEEGGKGGERGGVQTHVPSDLDLAFRSRMAWLHQSPGPLIIIPSRLLACLTRPVVQ